MRSAWLLLMVCCAFGAASLLHAEIQIYPKVDADAPSFGEPTWAANAPHRDSVDDYLGEPVLVFEWNWEDKDSLAYLLAFDKLYEKKKAEGLHIFAFHREMPSAAEATHEDIVDFVIEHGISYPVASDGGTSYSARFRPNAWVIGVDGKIKFADHPRKYNASLTKELAKVQYPGLFRYDIHEHCEKAAEAFVDGDYPKARELANEVLADHDDEKGAVVDAEYILEHIETLHENVKERLKAAQDSGNQLLVLRLYEWVEERFDDTKHATEAEQALELLDDDEAAQDQIDALEDLEKLVEKLAKKQTELADVKTELEDFIDDDKLADTYALTLATEALEADNPCDHVRLALSVE